LPQKKKKKRWKAKFGLRARVCPSQV
jgi:hypothetical protein